MKVVFHVMAWDDYQHWVDHDADALRKLNTLFDQCRRDAFQGTGKPEPLKGEWKGWWSRRISRADRLVYRVAATGIDQRLEIAQCRFHYD